MMIGIDVSKFSTQRARELQKKLAECDKVAAFLCLICEVQDALLSLCDKNGCVREEHELEGEELVILRSWALEKAVHILEPAHRSALIAYQLRGTPANLTEVIIEPKGDAN